MFLFVSKVIKELTQWFKSSNEKKKLYTFIVSRFVGTDLKQKYLFYPEKGLNLDSFCKRTYRIGDKSLNKGGFADVYTLIQETDDGCDLVSPFVVRLCRICLPREKKKRERHGLELFHEISMLNTNRGNNDQVAIVKNIMFGTYMENNHTKRYCSYFSIDELCLGGDVFEAYQKGFFYNNIHLIARLTQEIDNALRFLRENNIVHSDVKHENIYLTSTNPYKCHFRLGDFGLSFRMNEKKRTSTGGTIGFFSPEWILQNGQTSPFSDLFSFGITLLWIVSDNTELINTVINRWNDTVFNNKSHNWLKNWCMNTQNVCSHLAYTEWSSQMSYVYRRIEKLIDFEPCQRIDTQIEINNQTLF